MEHVEMHALPLPPERCTEGCSHPPHAPGKCPRIVGREIYQEPCRCGEQRTRSKERDNLNIHGGTTMTATAEDLSAYREYVEGRIEDGDVDEGLLTFDQWLPTHIEAVREWDAAPPERAP